VSKLALVKDEEMQEIHPLEATVKKKNFSRKPLDVFLW